MADGASIHRVPAEAATAAESPAAPARLDAVRELRRPAPEAEPPAAPVARPAAEQPASPIVAKPANSSGRDWKRPCLFALLPLALVAGGYFYTTGGRIMSTDNAYVQADMVGVSTDVPGTLVAIEVHDNEAVKKGQILYRLKPDTFQIALDGAKAQLGAVHDQILTLQGSYKLALAQIEQAQADLAFYQTVSSGSRICWRPAPGRRRPSNRAARSRRHAAEDRGREGAGGGEPRPARRRPRAEDRRQPALSAGENRCRQRATRLERHGRAGAVRRRRHQRRRHSRRLLFASLAAGVQPRFDLARSGSRRARRKPN